MEAVLGILAGVVAIGDTSPYVRDTLRGSTRPHRGTWLIWATLATAGDDRDRRRRRGGQAPGAVGALDLSLLLYPVYYFLANGALALLIHRRQAVLAAAPVPA